MHIMEADLHSLTLLDILKRFGLVKEKSHFPTPSEVAEYTRALEEYGIKLFEDQEHRATPSSKP